MKPAAVRRLARCALAATLGAAGCTEINTGADHVASLSFDALPSPAVVAGDTLRDSLGVAAPLAAIAFNNGGSVVANAPIQYIALDTGVTITAQAYVIATRRAGSVPIVANAGIIQSRQRTLLVARRPDSLIATDARTDTVDYVLPDSPGVNVSAPLGVKIATGDSAGGVTTTQGWRVIYRVFFRGAEVAPGDTSVVYLVDGSKRTAVDTTDATGLASRALRVRPIGITASATDSVIVLASATYKGVQVRGSPLRFVVLLRPKLQAGTVPAALTVLPRRTR